MEMDCPLWIRLKSRLIYLYQILLAWSFQTAACWANDIVIYETMNEHSLPRHDWFDESGDIGFRHQSTHVFTFTFCNVFSDDNDILYFIVNSLKPSNAYLRL